MSAGESVVALKRGVRIKGVALPVEHGSWGFLFEPLVGAFLARGPLNIQAIQTMILTALNDEEIDKPGKI